MENENVNFQNIDFFVFADMYIQLGFTLIDILHLWLCKTNSIDYFISKDRQFIDIKILLENSRILLLLNRLRNFTKF